ncbi:hypothetical protein Xmau_02287 [Xenorhabdus mauleonii]|uniref:Stationary-phase-induced ribosome-associated protein n=1 Tax=Xenorhabdus mauleonii TaxID=351675 RepID=A0A1I3Q4A5_9GAMM|nr:stationary-phase-induced ribosome-associated protein [Xenorhabdus mauleonii]PHM40101.1 hypothetical protein Xmau_02287 [Xenorhabdus mauleonii]SFJ28247.1 30S ribosomal protein subunit S22 family protein [Xenorhabdus mauleonii]
MLSNRAARRLLGMSYKVSNSKRRVTVSLLKSGDNTHQLPEHLSNSSFVVMKRNAVSGKTTYHSGNIFYPAYMSVRQ